jgi:hypothetical protein
VTGRVNIERFLATDPRDVGCKEAMEILHVYAEVATSGRKSEELYPGVAAHLRSCGPCAEDLQGLLSALEADP